MIKMCISKKRFWVIVIAYLLLAVVILSTVIFALNSSYTYSPVHADRMIKEGEMCELTIEYNGAKGKPDKEVIYVEAFSTYNFPEIERDGFKFFCWFCNFVACKDSVEIRSKKIRAIAQFEKDYSLVNAPCAIYNSNTAFDEFEVGDYPSINKKVKDVYLDGGYKAIIYSKENFKGKQTEVYYQGVYSGKIGSMKVEKLSTNRVKINELNDETKYDLLKSYAPRFWWDEDEQYYASSVEFALQNLSRTLSPDGYMGVISDLDSPSYKSDYLYGDKQNMKTYGFIVEKEYKYLDLCYYLYFPYNKAKEIFGIEFGNHIGDWEHLNVRLLLDEDGEDWYITPIFAQYSIHSERIYMPWENVPKIDNTHPVGYIANGSHGIWPYAGKNVYKDLFIIKLSDVCSEGEAWNTWEGNSLETYSYDALTWSGKGIGNSEWNTCFDHDFYNDNSNAIIRWGNYGFDYPVQLYPRLQNAPEGPTCKKSVFNYFTMDTKFVY